MGRMNQREAMLKQLIFHDLLKDGYKTYAKLFNMFDLHIVNWPNFAAAVNVQKAVIYLEDGILRSDQSTLIRHEILHRWMEHFIRLQQHVGGKKLTRREHELANIAGDYDISNKGYTEHDKDIVRNLKINGIPFPGLVTELDHKDWVNLSFEEMYDRLVEESKQEQQQAIQNLMNDLRNEEGDDEGDEGGGSSSQSGQSGQDSSEDSEGDDSSSSSGGNQGDEGDEENNGQNNQSSGTSSGKSKKVVVKSKDWIRGFKAALADIQSGKVKI